MNGTKRIVLIMSIIIISMLIIPLIAVNVIKAEAGMAFTLLMFFVIYPVISVFIGIISGEDIRRFWFAPILVAGLFWMFASLIYAAAFTISYSVIYFLICSASMLFWRVIIKLKK